MNFKKLSASIITLIILLNTGASAAHAKIIFSSNITKTTDNELDVNLSDANLTLPQTSDTLTTCTEEGKQVYNTTDDMIYYCNGSSWVAVDAGGSTPDFEAIYAADGDNTLDINDNFTIDLIANSADNKSINIGAKNTGSGTGEIHISAQDVYSLSSGGTASIGASNGISISSGNYIGLSAPNDITVSNGGDFDVNSANVDLEATSGALALSGNTEVSITADGSTLTIDGGGDAHTEISNATGGINFSMAGPSTINNNSNTLSITSSGWNIYINGAADFQSVTTYGGATGISGKGSTQGGFFQDSDPGDDGRAWLGVGNEGIRASGSETGGHFATAEGAPSIDLAIESTNRAFHAFGAGYISSSLGVGGPSSVDARLHVRGDIRSTANITESKYVEMGHDSLKGYVNSSSDDLQLQEGGNTRITIEAITGDVGINNTDPAYDLDVTGNIRATSDLYVNGDDIHCGETTCNINDQLYTTGRVGIMTTPNASYGLTVGSSLYAMTNLGAGTTPHSSYGVRGYNSITGANFANASSSIDLATGGHAFYGSGNGYISGNLALGSDSSPEAGLEISGSSWPNTFIYLKSTGAGDSGFRFCENNSCTTAANIRFHFFNSNTENALRLHPEGGDGVYFTDNNRVGIGVAAPTYRLQLPNSTTNSVGRAQANSWATYSDTRVKLNQEEIKYGLEEVMQLQPRKYTHHGSEIIDEQLTLKEDDLKDSIGFIAQEVHEVIPEIVEIGESETDLWGLDYDKFTPVLTKAIQELKAEKDSEMAEIKNTQTVNSDLLKELKARQALSEEELGKIKEAYASLLKRLEALENQKVDKINFTVPLSWSLIED
jgi:hypothetical protein